MLMVEPSDETLPNLHDAVLERVVIDWDQATARIELIRVPRGPMALELRGLVDFKLTRRQEWGPSVFVNGAEIPTATRASRHSWRWSGLVISSRLSSTTSG